MAILTADFSDVMIPISACLLFVYFCFDDQNGKMNDIVVAGRSAKKHG
jgi:hypothetical protein